MIQFFRKFFSSKLGLAITLAFLGLIALAFASMDVSGSGAFGGVSGGDRVAVVGSEKIGVAELSRTASSALDQVRRENPTATMQAFVEQGGLEEVLNQMVDRYAIREYAEEYGLRAGDNLINSEIITIGAFRGPDGNFDQDTYLNAIRQQGLTDAMVRRDLGSGLLAQQMMRPATIATRLPSKIARRYAALLKERRKGAIAIVPSTAFAPKGEPSDAELQEFYSENRSRYIRPERRVLRFASFGPDNVTDRIEPTDAEIAARYERDKANYAASETRTITQLIVPTEAAAKSIRDRVAAGASLDAVAREAGFSTAKVGPATKNDLAASTSAAVADAVFAAPQGTIATPARSALGWSVARVDSVDRRAARSLAAVTPDIRDVLRQEKRNAALADLSARMEEMVDGGASLSEVAEEFGLEMETTPELTADGRFYGDPNMSVNQQLGGVLETAFQMEEGEPQLAELVRGELFLLFETSDITPSATAPLKEIKDQVAAAWKLSEGSRLAREASDRVIKRVRGGATLAAAIAAEKVTLPQVDNIDLNRQELVQQQNQQVPPPLALMFSMAEGTTKKLEAGRDIGWFVVDLKDISTDEIAADDPLIGAARQQLAQALSSEYSEQLVAAMRKEVGVEINDSAVEAVRKQLTGEN